MPGVSSGTVPGRGGTTTPDRRSVTGHLEQSGGVISEPACRGAP
jgi:hypothetical protein